MDPTLFQSKSTPLTEDSKPLPGDIGLTHNQRTTSGSNSMATANSDAFGGSGANFSGGGGSGGNVGNGASNLSGGNGGGGNGDSSSGDENDNDNDDNDGDGDGDGHNSDSRQDGAKRPRLRLAHACDRCRKRKIRCDTQQPCGPCQATRNECTFHTPSRRVTKPKNGTSEIRSSSTSGIKRPHSPPNGGKSSTHSRISLLTGGAKGESSANLEARLAALEAMLGDVPPKVHNAFLSSLDAKLGSGTGVGLKEGGKGEGIGVSLEALAGGDFNSILSNFGLENNPSFTASNFGSTSGSMLPPTWGATNQNITAGVLGLRRKEDEGVNEMAKRMEGMSFFYEDEIGQAKWQGATSGFPLLDLLTASNVPSDQDREPQARPSSLHDPFASPPSVDTPPDLSIRRVSSNSTTTLGRTQRTMSRDLPSSPTARKSRFFPDRNPRPHQTLNPEASWKVITGVIPPDLMDTLVRCYLSTSHLLWPFLHVPSFLADYANPQQWGEPGFACFIVAVCTLSSRHVDDPRVRANPQDPSTAGKGYFELFKRLRDLPSADRPTLYSIQAAFLAAIYAFGLGNLSKAFALLAESITLCLDGGLHRSVDGYDHFDAVERETRKRTFWSIYSWDKQSAALFGRPPVIHLRDCDVTEPMVVDDEDLTPEGVKENSQPNNSRMCAFVAAIRLHVILEGVIDAATQPSTFPTSPFLAQASATIARRSPQNETLRDEEALLDEWTRILPKYWAYDTDTANSRDPIRITQAERLHCLEHLVKMLIYRHRFSGFVAMPASTAEERNRHLDLCRKAMQCALTIIADHVHISQRGMMTYYGVHVIHQLAQAGRTLVAVVLNCRNADFRPIIAPSIEGLRSCVGLLRRFSGRYLCGLRSADIIDEFCRICNIPVDSPRVPDGTGRPSPAWLRPVRKRASPSPAPPERPSPSALLDAYTGGSGDIMSNPAATGAGVPPTDLEALFNTSDYFDMSAMSPVQPGSNTLGGFTGLDSLAQNNNNSNNTPQHHNQSLNNHSVGGMSMLDNSVNDFAMPNLSNGLNGLNGDVRFDYSLGGMGGMGGFGGEALAGEGMDTVSDGLKGNEAGQGLSAATILSLLEEGSFDYGSVFTDQAPLPMDFGSE